jgi:hypothetical protein
MSSNNNNNRDTDSHTLIENETEEQSKNDGITSKAGKLLQKWDGQKVCANFCNE